MSILIILFILLLILFAIIGLRGQRRRQHRELLSAVNPEKLAEMDAAAHAEARAQWIARLGIVGFVIVVGLFFGLCSEIPKLWQPKHLKPPPVATDQPVKPVTTVSVTPSATPADGTVTMKIYPPGYKPQEK